MKFTPKFLSVFIALSFSLLLSCTAQEKEKDQTKFEIPSEWSEEFEIATLAGGCFWCMETPFENIEGVKAVISGYSGGEEVDPSYHDVAYGRTGHTESVQVFFDPEVVTYDEILDIYWRQINPTDLGGQFADRGKQYRPEIFVHSESQRKIAEKSREALENSGRFPSPIVVPITEFGAFYPAENYHQDFYKKDPQRYYGYRRGSGRESYLEKVWSK